MIAPDRHSAAGTRRLSPDATTGAAPLPRWHPLSYWLGRVRPVWHPLAFWLSRRGVHPMRPAWRPLAAYLPAHPPGRPRPYRVYRIYHEPRRPA